MLGYLVAYVQVIVNRTNFVLSRESAMSVVADFSGVLVEYLVVVSAWLCFAFGQNKLKSILKMLQNIHEMSQKIGMEQDFEKIVKTVEAHTFFVNLIWIILLCGDHMILANHKAFRLEVWLPFNLPRIVTNNVVIMFVNSLLVVQNSFHSLNGSIFDLSNEATSRPYVIVKSDVRGSKNYDVESFGSPGTLEVCGQIHSDLVTVTKMIVDFFSLSIILVLLIHFIQMSTDLYLACLLAKDSESLGGREKLTLAVLCGWFCLRFAQTVAVMAICESTANEANRAGSVLHTMLISVHAEKYLDLAHILSFRLLQTRLNIDLYGLLEMRLSLIHRIIGMVGTYITVMIQLDTPDSQQQKIDRPYEEAFGSEVPNGTLTTGSY